jgi:hypothetical protein
MSVYQDLPNLTRFPDSRFIGHLLKTQIDLNS